ncbi:MAG: dTMP kinase [Candidatus Micrarchaeia archaeon]|jgi:dTMP kinase
MVLIVFEGIDGTGKTTQIKKFFNELIKTELPTHFYKYHKPFKNSEINRHLNERVKHSAKSMMNFYLREMKRDMPLIKKENKSGFILIDRYFYSTISYQGQSLGIEKIIDEIKKRDLLIPNYVVWFDIGPNISAERRRNATGSNIFEKDFKMQSNCREIYQKLYEEKPFGATWIKIDITNKSIEEVWEELKNILLDPILKQTKTL